MFKALRMLKVNFIVGLALGYPLREKWWQKSTCYPHNTWFINLLYEIDSNIIIFGFWLSCARETRNTFWRITINKDQ